MKIIALQGSPRKKGNTARVLEWMEEEIKATGHEIEIIYLNSKKINGCLGCTRCKDKPDSIGCIQKDDGIEILEKITGAELVIFASPLYFWGVTAQLKAVIDRTYSLYVNYRQPDHKSLVEGQRQALVSTGADPYENNAEPVITAFKRLQGPHKAVNAGELFIGSCTTPENMDDTVRAAAIEFAGKITA